VDGSHRKPYYIPSRSQWPCGSSGLGSGTRLTVIQPITGAYSRRQNQLLPNKLCLCLIIRNFGTRKYRTWWLVSLLKLSYWRILLTSSLQCAWNNCRYLRYRWQHINEGYEKQRRYRETVVPLRGNKNYRLKDFLGLNQELNTVIAILQPILYPIPNITRSSHVKGR
jgi:hypothetical protein